MNILQITDLHISIPNNNPFDVDCIKAFEDTLNEGLSRYNIDLIVLSGDLCQKEPDANVYTYLKNILEKAQIPYHIISGNHDTPHMINRYMYDAPDNNKLYYAEKVQDYNFIYLDTTTGYLTAEQWSWLENELSIQAEKIILFMHHPPSLAHVPHMDINYSFKENDKFCQMLHQYKNTTFQIFCGHYHNERTIVDGNIQIFITPSTFMQISDETTGIKVFHTKPAYRIIQLENQKLTTFVNYLYL